MSPKPSKPSANETIDYVVLDTAYGRFGVAATAKGLCALHVCRGAEGADDARAAKAIEKWAMKHRPGWEAVRHDESGALPRSLDRSVKALTDYLDGGRPASDLPIDLAGTPFQIRVWRALLEIPYGATVSYGDLAVTVGHPKGARAVGNAVGDNPVGLLVPCHRVVRGNGELGGYGGGIELKKTLLKLEGIDPESPLTRKAAGRAAAASTRRTRGAGARNRRRTANI